MSNPEGSALAELLQADEAAAIAGLKGNKRYMPPKPDANTFDTQQEFVDSLIAIPITSVEEHNRRCPHCWKCYGESDPGLNNAEEPIKFRCGHVFGQQCMKQVFRLPIHVKMELHPISYGPGSRGAKLGDKLDRFIARVAKESNSIHDLRDVMKSLVLRIETPERGQSVANIIGPEWLSLLHQVVHSHHQLLKVHLLENGLVYDISETKPIVSFLHQSFPLAFESSTAVSSIDAEVQGLILHHLEKQTLGQDIDVYSILYGKDAKWDDSMSSSSLSTPQNSMPDPATSIEPKATSASSAEPNVPPPTSAEPKFAPATGMTFTVPTGATSSSSIPNPGSMFLSVPQTLQPTPIAPTTITAGLEVFDFDSFLTGTGANYATDKPPSNKTTAEVYELATEYMKSRFPNAPPLDTVDELIKKAEGLIKAKMMAVKKKADATKKLQEAAESFPRDLPIIHLDTFLLSLQTALQFRVLFPRWSVRAFWQKSRWTARGPQPPATLHV